VRLTHVPASTHTASPHVNRPVSGTALSMQRCVSVLMQVPVLSQRPVVLSAKTLADVAAHEARRQRIAVDRIGAAARNARVGRARAPSEAARSQRRHSPPMPPVPAQDATLQHTPCWQNVEKHSDPTVHVLAEVLLARADAVAGRSARAGAGLASDQAHVVQSRNVRVAELATRRIDASHVGTSPARRLTVAMLHSTKSVAVLQQASRAALARLVGSEALARSAVPASGSAHARKSTSCTALRHPSKSARRSPASTVPGQM
jgi:hypothetical protein